MIVISQLMINSHKNYYVQLALLKPLPQLIQYPKLNIIQKIHRNLKK
jgi:hypothetical protein